MDIQILETTSGALKGWNRIILPYLALQTMFFPVSTLEVYISKFMGLYWNNELFKDFLKGGLLVP